MSEKVCLVTGVGPGTGSAISRRFAAGGYRVAMVARNRERLDQLESEIPGSKGFVCDVSDEQEVNQTIKRVVEGVGQP